MTNKQVIIEIAKHLNGVVNPTFPNMIHMQGDTHNPRRSLVFNKLSIRTIWPRDSKDLPGQQWEIMDSHTRFLHKVGAAQSPEDIAKKILFLIDENI